MAGNKNSGNKTTYKPIYIKRAEEYLAKCVDTEEKKIVQENTETKYTMYKTVLKINLPTIEGLAKYIKKSIPTLFTWAKAYKEFDAVLDKIKLEQKQRLLERGLEGVYNPTIAKLILANNHGMRESTDITTDGKPINNSFTDDQVNRIADRISRRQDKSGNTPSEKQSN